MHIGISGPIASGKSTLARSLVAVFDLMEIKARITPFAEDLKWMASLYGDKEIISKLGMYFHNLGYGDDIIDAGIIQILFAMMMYPPDPIAVKKPRKLYQYLGTEAGRYTVDEDLWVNAVKRRIKDDNTNRYFISDDMRFTNESEAVDYHVNITVDSADGLEAYQARIASLPADYVANDHESENQQLSAPHYTLPTNFTTVEVVDLAKAINHQWRAKHYLTYGKEGKTVLTPFVKSKGFY